MARRISRINSSNDPGRLTDDEIAQARATAAGLPSPEKVEMAKLTLDTVEQTERAYQRYKAVLDHAKREDQSFETAIDNHNAIAAGAQFLRAKLADSSLAHLDRAADVIVGRGNALLPKDELATFRARLDGGMKDEERRKFAAKTARREARKAKQLKVKYEPGPYDKGSPNSWPRDVLVHLDPSLTGLFGQRSGLSNVSPEATVRRLEQNAIDVQQELRKGGKVGKRYARMLREYRRCDDPIEHEKRHREELRALTTGGGITAAVTSGASAFVPPVFLMQQWAEYRSPYRAFADQCDGSVDLPRFGLEVYVPAVTTGTTVTTQTEGSAVSEGDPVATLINGPVVSKAGQITVSQQFLDRAGPGVAGDVFLFQQLKNQMDAQIDAYAIAQAIAGAGSVTNAGAFALAAVTGVGGLLKDLKTAKNSLHDAAGIRVRGTHVFAIGDFCDFVGSYSDAQGRPVFSPTFDGNLSPVTSVGDAQAMHRLRDTRAMCW